MDDVVLTLECSKVNIFVTGKYGVGKTTFIKGLFSGKVEAAIGVRSTNIRSYTFKTNTHSLTVHDTPGQEINSTSYLKWMHQNFNDSIDVVLFCIKMDDQVRPEDIQALASLAKTFGTTNVWNRTVIVLTHANQVAPVDQRRENIDTYYSRIQSSLITRIKDILQDPAYGIALSANGLPVVPAGHPREYTLPDCDDWRSGIIDALSTHIEQSLLEQLVHDDALNVAHCTSISYMREQAPWFWCKMILGFVCIAGGAVLTSRPRLGVTLGVIGGVITFLTLCKQPKIVYKEHA